MLLKGIAKLIGHGRLDLVHGQCRQLFLGEGVAAEDALAGYLLPLGTVDNPFDLDRRPWLIIRVDRLTADHQQIARILVLDE